MRGLAVVSIALIGCQARLGGDLGDDVTDDAPLFGLDAPPPDVPLGPFGAPQKIAVAADATAREDDGSLSHSGLELVFAVVDPNDGNQKDLFYAARPDLQSAFGTATKLPFSATGTSEETPRFSDDDLTLFFAKTVGTGNLDVASPAPRRARRRGGRRAWSRASTAQASTSGSCRARATATC